MKNFRWLLLVALGTVVTADAANNTTAELVCRKNDPFVFCTQGCTKQQDDVHEWELQGGRTKQPTGNQNACLFPTLVGINTPYYSCSAWSITAFRAWFQYDQVCKDMYHHGGRASDWEGQERPEDTPESH